MALFGNLFKKKEPPKEPTPEEKWASFYRTLSSNDCKTLDELGIHSLSQLDKIPMNLLQMKDFSNDAIQWLEPIQASILADSHLASSLNGILHERFQYKYKNTKLTFTVGDMAWWWLCKDYSLIDQVTSTIHRENVHEFMLCSTCIFVENDIHEINYRMAPDVYESGRQEMYLGYPEHGSDYYVERYEINKVWSSIANAFSNGIEPAYSPYEDRVHAFISRTRTGFGWRW